MFRKSIMVSGIVVLIITVTLNISLSIPVDDPTNWPGHLEPFGSKQKTVDIDKHYFWPSPKGKYVVYIYIITYVNREKGIFPRDFLDYLSS